MVTHKFNNQASQVERREVLRNDTYFARQQNTADDAGGRFTKLTPSNLTGQSQQLPQLPPSSPWANGFDQNLELPFGVDVNALGTEQASTEPALSPTTEAALPPDVVDRAGEPVVSAVSFVASQATGSHSNKRRGW
jgi:hypothetical protein